MCDKKILTVQDISCVGQCSLTVALPIISACGIETCILPSAILSTHTGGFKGYTFRDLTDDIPGITSHWLSEGIRFDAFYSGYLGSKRQIELVKNMIYSLLNDDSPKIVDPAMADNGKLYYGFNDEFVEAMAGLCGEADIILPNITEASFMTKSEYVSDSYDEEYVKMLIEKLHKLGAKTIVLTGVSYSKDQLGIAISEGNSELKYYFHERVMRSSHGTGDVYASAFSGALVRGRSVYDSAKIAADYTLECIKCTDSSHWYGVRFEKALPKLIRALEQ